MFHFAFVKRKDVALIKGLGSVSNRMCLNFHNNGFFVNLMTKKTTLSRLSDDNVCK
jgi:hypothetical protein